MAAHDEAPWPDGAERIRAVIMTKTPSIFQFRVKWGTNVWRDFEIDGSDTLENLAMAILDAYEFNSDHCYGFYSNLKGDRSKSEEIYELFADQPESYSNEKAKGVVRILIQSVFTRNKHMLFLFDYGDQWEFRLKCTGVAAPEPKVKYPRVTGIKGDAPEQYPEYEE